MKLDFWKKNKTKDKYDVLLICNDEDKGEIKDGKYFSKLLDSTDLVLKSQKFKTLSLALPFASRYGKVTASNAIAINKRVFVIRIIRKTLLKLNLYENLEYFLEKYNLTEDSIYKKILKKYEIKLVICIGANKYICQACRKFKINLVELLHAIGYAREPFGWLDEDIKNLPTHIWSLDRTSTKIFKPLEEKGIIIDEIENPWFSQFDNFKKGSFGSISFLTKNNNLIKNKKIVLLSLTWGYANDEEDCDICLKNILENGLIPSCLLEILNDQNQDIFWFIRRHPMQQAKRKYNYQVKLLDEICNKNKNVDWREASKVALPYLLPYIDCHITMRSHVCYDTALYGIRTLGLCPTLLEGNPYQFAFKDLEEANLFERGLMNKKYILNFILNSKKDKPFKLTSKKDNDFIHTINNAFKKNK